jgi:hypothetical protein
VKIELREQRGRCRWCGCTWHDPCPPGCDWANRQATLCTECVDFDKKMRSAGGRRELVETYNAGREIIEATH